VDKTDNRRPNGSNDWTFLNVHNPVGFTETTCFTKSESFPSHNPLSCKTPANKLFIFPVCCSSNVKLASLGANHEPGHPGYVGKLYRSVPFSQCRRRRRRSPVNVARKKSSTNDRVSDQREVCNAGSNQLIVGPDSWSYQVLRQTFGERFMARSEASIFIDRSVCIDLKIIGC